MNFIGSFQYRPGKISIVQCYTPMDISNPKETFMNSSIATVIAIVRDLLVPTFSIAPSFTAQPQSPSSTWSAFVIRLSSVNARDIFIYQKADIMNSNPETTLNRYLADAHKELKAPIAVTKEANMKRTTSPNKIQIMLAFIFSPILLLLISDGVLYVASA